MKKAVLFDLDDTLYDYYFSSNKGLDAVYKVLKRKMKISKKDFLRTFEQSKKEVRYELNNSPDSHDRMIYFQKMGEKLRLNLDLTLRFFEVYHKTFLKNIKPRKNVQNVFRKIKSQNLKIIIVTNEVVEIQLNKIKKLGLMKYVDYFVTSENVGVDKPNKKIFLYALKKINAKPSQAIMVGDSETNDIKGAGNCKITTVLLNNKNIKSKSDYVITDLKEVLKIINSFNN